MWYKKFHAHMLPSLKIIQVFLKWSKKSNLEMSFPNGSHLGFTRPVCTN